MRTQQEIENEIQGLERVKERIPRYAHFNDDNYAAIDAQIRVLREGLTYDQAFDTFTESTHELDHALYAVGWRDDCEDSLVYDWPV
jgi:hypothetical protein